MSALRAENVSGAKGLILAAAPVATELTSPPRCPAEATASPVAGVRARARVSDVPLLAPWQRSRWSPRPGQEGRRAGALGAPPIRGTGGPSARKPARAGQAGPSPGPRGCSPAGFRPAWSPWTWCVAAWFSHDTRLAELAGEVTVVAVTEAECDIVADADLVRAMVVLQSGPQPLMSAVGANRVRRVTRPMLGPSRRTGEEVE